MISDCEKKIKDFSSQVQVAACFVEVGGQFLVLKYSQKKHEGCWNIPGGKVEKGELVANGASRELFEETGILSEEASLWGQVGQLYIRKPQIDYELHIFQAIFSQKPKVTLSDEHVQYLWVDEERLRQLNSQEIIIEMLAFYKKLKNEK